jgi:3alpha(or 20beta)-hydroxysteroid dehydrogenase
VAVPSIRRSMSRLEEEVAIVTGGARGLGEAITRRMVAEGARVVIADVLEEEGARLVEELGDRVRFEWLDVRDADRWQAVVAAAEQDFGRVTVLVNNAGVVEFAALLDTTEESFRRVVDINQVGVFLGLRAVAPSMRAAGRGAVVNMSSAAGMQGYAGIVYYVASKWAVRGMTKAAALELAPWGIRVNSVHPGTTRSPMTPASMRRRRAAPCRCVGWERRRRWPRWSPTWCPPRRATPRAPST